MRDASERGAGGWATRVACRPATRVATDAGRRPEAPARLATALALAVLSLPGSPSRGDDAAQFFESKIRPLLVEHCQRCHGETLRKSGLRVDSRTALLAGGETGPAVVPGKPEESLLVAAVRYEALEMPPDKRLPPEAVRLLEQWVRDGAFWPGEAAVGPALRSHGREIGAADRAYWAFQPVRRPALPRVDPMVGGLAWPRGDIDLFVLARLRDKGLVPSGAAAARTLVRRLFLDLTGLPPTPEEVEAFVRDPSDAAYERLVDDLLARPQYGERWGRHWLDIVRFAQTNGYERDDEKPHAWRYRDYVIRALNEDKPYDQFLREQLAGDELDSPDDAAYAATGFYRLGVWDDEPDDGRQAEFDNLDDMLSVTGAAMLGVSIGCARCHDHKFDPFTQEDYYSLLAFLRNVHPMTKGGGDAERTIFRRLSDGGLALAVHERPGTPPPTHVLLRGDAGAPAKEVAPRFPTVLCRDPAEETPSISPREGSSGRRRALAAWITSPENPLTPRVIVNRLWHHHFGRGVVATPSDFGRTGTPPTHPELLDLLADELVRGGWRLKPMHKRILLSATYRQDSRRSDPRAEEIDPDNTLLWRQNLRRLEAEAIRDAVLAVSGRLNPAMGGRGVFPKLAPEVLATQSRPGNGWDSSGPDEASRRSVYIFVKRTLGVPLLETLDAARADTSTAARATTTIAPQALMLLNSEFMDEQARAFADRLLRERDTQAGRIDRALGLVAGRVPGESERVLLESLLERQRVRAAQLAQVMAPVDSLEDSGPPPPGWSIYGKGFSWHDGVWSARPSPGGKVVCATARVGDGEVAARVRLAGAGGDAGLLLRVSEPTPGTDSLRGYNINLQAGRLRLGRHANNWQAMVVVEAPVEPGRWHQLRARVEGARVRVWLDDAESPLIDHVDPDPLPAGLCGFRVFSCAAEFAGLAIDGREQGLPPPASPSPAPRLSAAEEAVERAAWTSLCRVLLNTNEFVYLD